MRQCYLTQEARLKGLEKCKQSAEQRFFDRIEAYNKKPLLCFVCKKALPYEKRHNKFCSHSCSASLGNLGVQRFFGKPKQETDSKTAVRCISCKICLFCGEKLDTRRGQRIYCGTRCHADHKRHLRRSTIRTAGRLVSCSKDKWYLEETRGRKCEICGVTEWQDKPVPLVLDHKDGNSDNNLLTNVRLICHNCDALTDTYCGKNKGNGRWTKRGKYRNARYNQGLSY